LHPFAWGILALHAHDVEEVVGLAHDQTQITDFHYTITDEKGGIIGIEGVGGKVAILREIDGLYIHANAPRAERFAKDAVLSDKSGYTIENSLFREKRLEQLLRQRPDRLTAQIAFYSLADTEGFPMGIIRCDTPDACTTAAVVAEPTKGLLHVSRGMPSQNWPVTYAL
jgi:hypothetical protein